MKPYLISKLTQPLLATILLATIFGIGALGSTAALAEDKPKEVFKCKGSLHAEIIDFSFSVLSFENKSEVQFYPPATTTPIQIYAPFESELTELTKLLTLSPSLSLSSLTVYGYTVDRLNIVAKGPDSVAELGLWGHLNFEKGYLVVERSADNFREHNIEVTCSRQRVPAAQPPARSAVKP
jgi:hypothetical protein